MAYRNIFIANTARLTTKNEQLVVDNGETFSFPVEDIRCVMVEDYRSTLSTALISKFANAGVTLLICDEKHIPTAALNPINCYSRQLKQIKLQAKATQPLKKRIWQQIVVSKIHNQAKCLEIIGKGGAEKLYRYASEVNSGDTSNVEGRAAAFYFKALFGKDFHRDDETPLNAALNYGYAIIRAVISRTVCLYGLEPSLGVHHCSELNNFNLSDDLIEPFRPFVDLNVAKFLFDYDEFGTSDKALLLKALNACVIVEGNKQSAANAVETAVQSYVECLKTGKAEITLPGLIDIEFRQYE
ncbi:MAG: type II CRISPR-associated endonuclease Cas1 [Clostridia bacterium]|nr:type II CRISPR-associated endonuclease Cas1 [Clostridia bacterium]